MMSNISDVSEHIHTYILVVWVDLASKKVLFLRGGPHALYNGIPTDHRTTDQPLHIVYTNIAWAGIGKEL